MADEEKTLLKFTADAAEVEQAAQQTVRAIDEVEQAAARANTTLGQRQAELAGTFVAFGASQFRESTVHGRTDRSRVGECTACGRVFATVWV